MKNAFIKAMHLFKYFAILFTAVFWIYMIYDDYIFIEKYGVNLEGIWLWILWYFAYFVGFTIYYWIISAVLILVYHKLIKQAKVS
jgi:hypothetical protein